MPKRVAFIIEDLSGGGAQRFAANLSRELDGNDYDINFLVGKDERFCEVSGRIQKIGFAGAPKWNFFQKVFRFLGRVLRLRQAKKAVKIEFALSAMDESNIANILSRVSERLILTVHSHRLHPLFNSGSVHKFLLNGLIRLLYRRADLCVAVSKGVARDYVNYFGVPENKMRVIYNMHDGAEIRLKAAEPLGEAAEAIFRDPVILTAGRLCKEKGQWHLIRSFAVLKKQVPEARLMLLGDGEYRDRLIALAEALGLRVYSEDRPGKRGERDVFFMGFQKNPYQFYSRASVFVFPSLYEGFGCVLTEAMACGTPVVSADCRFGPREILAPDTDFLHETKIPEFASHGVLMPVFDGAFRKASVSPTSQEIVWGKTIARFLGNSKLRQDYSQKGLTRSADFEVSRIAPVWMECLAQLDQIPS